MRRRYRKARKPMTPSRHMHNVLGGLKKRGMSKAECVMVKSWLTPWVLDKLCAYCGKKVSPLTFSLDHMDPLSRGGENRQRNLALCCDPCNRAKGSLDREEFVLLLGALGSIGDYAKTNVLARLKAAGRYYHR